MTFVYENETHSDGFDSDWCLRHCATEGNPHRCERCGGRMHVEDLYDNTGTPARLHVEDLYDNTGTPARLSANCHACNPSGARWTTWNGEPTLDELRRMNGDRQ